MVSRTVTAAVCTRVIGFVGATLMGAALSMLVFAPAAHAYTYDGPAAAAYAHKWSANASTLRNSAYKKFENDCANFVSQALRAGGMPNDVSGSNVWSYNHHFYGDTHTSSWTVALLLVQYLNDSGRGSVDSMAHSMANRYTSAQKGDVYAYEWGDDDGHLDHVSLASGWGTFANYYDATARRNYRSITRGSGDYMSQHTRDRDYAPWNWGYQTQRNLITRSKMNTWIIHID